MVVTRIGTTIIMLYLIGLGLGDAKDITVRGLEIVKNAHEVYLEAYTSILTVGKDALVKLCHGNFLLVVDISTFPIFANFRRVSMAELLFLPTENSSSKRLKDSSNQLEIKTLHFLVIVLFFVATLWRLF